MKQKIKRGLLYLIIILGLVYVGLRLASQPVEDYAFFDHDGVMVMAHAGGKGLWPDNTFFAMEQAVAMGVDVLEMDIHASSDGVIMVRHDDTIDAYSDGSGFVKEMTQVELQSFDAAYQWTPDGGETYPYRGQGIIIPTLEEIFAAFPNQKMNVEIKQKEPSIASEVCRLIDAYEMQDNILIASFHPESITEFREVCPEIATSGVENEIRLFYGLNLARLGPIWFPSADAFQVPEYFGELQVISDRFVANAHHHNVAVHVWTVNDPSDMQRMIDAGVDGIITDRPDLLIELLKEN